MNIKSERLKKLETELEDLEQWMQLGLVPKKDVDKHKEEIRSLKAKIEEEKERIRFLKESGDLEEYVTPKRSAARQAYAEPHTLPDMDGGENLTDAGLEMETESFEMETIPEDETESGGSGTTEEEGTLLEEADEEDPFSDRNRWKRGILEDPDADNWWVFYSISKAEKIFGTRRAGNAKNVSSLQWNLKSCNPMSPG